MLLHVLFLLFAAAAAGCFALLVLAPWLFESQLPHSSNDGDFVGEVWLEWPVCTGSTLYRQRFRTQRMAALYVKLHAMKLDGLLPKRYRAEMSDGRRYWEDYDYGIYFGVRALTAHEREHGVQALWSPMLPGNPDSTSEHRSAHPVWGDNVDLQALGYKV